MTRQGFSSIICQARRSAPGNPTIHKAYGEGNQVFKRTRVLHCILGGTVFLLAAVGARLPPLRRDQRDTWKVGSVSTRITGQYRPLHDCGVRADVEVRQDTVLGAAASPIIQEDLADEKKCLSRNGLHGERAFDDYGFEFFDPGKSD